MKKFFLLIVVALFISAINVYSQFRQRQPTPNDTLNSVRVLPNGNVVLSIYAPEAETVSIGGDIVPFGQELESKKSNGIGSFTIPDVKAGTYRYNFVIDGIRIFDPKAENASETSALLDVLPNGENEFFAIHGWSGEPTFGILRQYCLNNSF